MYVIMWLFLGSLQLPGSPNYVILATAPSIIAGHSQPGLCNKEECVAVISDNPVHLVIVPYDIQGFIQLAKDKKSRIEAAYYYLILLIKSGSILTHAISLHFFLASIAGCPKYVTPGSVSLSTAV